MKKNSFMNLFSWSRSNRLPLVCLFVALVTLAAVVGLFGWQSDADSSQYEEAIQYMGSHNWSAIAAIPHRMLRPGGVLLALPLTAVVSPFAAMMIENVAFYFLSVFIFYKLCSFFLEKKESTVVAVIFFVSAFPLLRFGLAALTDMGAWFFYLVSLVLTMRYLQTPKRWLIIVNGLLSGCGVLIKESGGVGALFFGIILIAINWQNLRYEYKKSAAAIALFGAFFLVPIVINQAIVYFTFHYTYLDWYIYNARTYGGTTYNLINVVKNTAVLFGLSWIFFGIGLVDALKLAKIRIQYFSLMAVSLSFILWPSVTARLMYISGPFLAITAAHGFEIMCKKNRVRTLILLGICVIVNFILVRLSYH